VVAAAAAGGMVRGALELDACAVRVGTPAVDVSRAGFVDDGFDGPLCWGCWFEA
jgi:hypothetical protein